MTIDACVCARGFRLDAASSLCVACGYGFYKTLPGNMEVCDACPDGHITYTTVSVSAFSCVADTTADTGGNTGDTGGTDGGGTSDNGTGNTSGTNDSNTSSSTDNTTDVGVSDPVLAQKNESNVPALTFNMSLGNFPDTADVESIKVRLIAP